MPGQSWSKEIHEALPTNLPFMDIQCFIYQPDSMKWVPSESEVSGWSVKVKCEMIREHLMVNGLDEKLWYEPPSSWLEYFGIMLEGYAEVIPKSKARRSQPSSKSDIPNNSKEE